MGKSADRAQTDIQLRLFGSFARKLDQLEQAFA